ncbi:glutathione S-transferase T3-like [Hordeum vulgare subsp. vulgare]|uniref:glutathione S-transferase T3-like n=1 Tax=Hordeum vulgare subsp. vulgare TaxID=112509 RepID=UPI001D1A3E20|nr:glutathione S-transferase T3-like [Hordeum vulgare subsp. vulgare]
MGAAVEAGWHGGGGGGGLDGALRLLLLLKYLFVIMDDDEAFLDIIDFGCTQTQPKSPIGEQPTPSTQHRSAITEKGKSHKGKNWSSDEDKVLIAAWANTSLDIVGTDQNRDTYWARISEYYNRQKESSWPERNDNAINCRYTFINRETSKFCGCLQQILNRQESGRTIEEKTNDAHILFKEMDPKKKKPFTLMHCYIEFSKYPKWQTRELETSVKKQKKTIDASPGTATNDPADASSVRTDATSIRTDALEHETRPDGVKKDKRGKADDIACKFSLETVWAAKQEKDEIKEAARNARYAQQLELRKEEIALKKKEDARNEREDARRQFELDERVMLMDTSGMTDAQKQFYQAKQKEILARGLE